MFLAVSISCFLLSLSSIALMCFILFQVMLGSGESKTETWMRWAESVYGEKFRGWVGFNVPVSHRITAGYEIITNMTFMKIMRNQI